MYTKDATLHLIKDNGVRWNSTYYMINRAIKLQAAIKRYCRDWRPAPHERYDLKGDFLDNEAWEELEHYKELLGPFASATKRIEGNAYTGTHGALWEVIPTMDYLFKRLQKRANQVTNEPDLFTEHYRFCINHGYDKLSEYYTKIDDSRLYAAALALHPLQKYSYFESV